MHEDAAIHHAVEAIVDGVDDIARRCEDVWGIGRLELLVSSELREKFRRQWDRFNDALQANDVERIRTTGEGMKRGWLALNQAALAAGAAPLEPVFWELRLSDGRVVALCRGSADAYKFLKEGRVVDLILGLDDITGLIEREYRNNSELVP